MLNVKFANPRISSLFTYVRKKMQKMLFFYNFLQRTGFIDIFSVVQGPEIGGIFTAKHLQRLFAVHGVNVPEQV